MTEDKQEKIFVERNKKIAELKLNAENLIKIKKSFKTIFVGIAKMVILINV